MVNVILLPLSSSCELCWLVWLWHCPWYTKLTGHQLPVFVLKVFISWLVIQHKIWGKYVWRDLISLVTQPLHQSPGSMILCDQQWELTHLYVAERTTEGGRAILLPSAPHRATVAHCPHWFQLAGGATAEPVKTQGGAFRSCQLRPSARLHKLTCTNCRAKN